MSKRKSFIRAILSGLLVLSLLAAFIAYRKYQDFIKPNVPAVLRDSFLCIPTHTSFDAAVEMMDSLGFLLDTISFRKVAERLQYKKPILRAGRFKIEPGWNNLHLVRHLRSGEQAPVNVVLTTERLLEDIAQKVARFIEADSAQLMALFMEERYLDSIHYSKETLMALFIPNTYQFYWNTSPRRFMERMLREHEIFWQKENRIEKARQLEMTPVEVYTLASIVERETNRNEEKARMAGVYLNRLRINMLLQADPTSVFATRDFAATRVLDYHKNFDSPYNTYKYPGLPPGPISSASIASIDAVLNAESHDYLYFCAKPDGSGLHSFAKTLAQHNVNAALYRQSLNERN